MKRAFLLAALFLLIEFSVSKSVVRVIPSSSRGYGTGGESKPYSHQTSSLGRSKSRHQPDLSYQTRTQQNQINYNPDPYLNYPSDPLKSPGLLSAAPIFIKSTGSYSPEKKFKHKYYEFEPEDEETDLFPDYVLRQQQQLRLLQLQQQQHQQQQHQQQQQLQESEASHGDAGRFVDKETQSDLRERHGAVNSMGRERGHINVRVIAPSESRATGDEFKREEADVDTVPRELSPQTLNSVKKSSLLSSGQLSEDDGRRVPVNIISRHGYEETIPGKSTFGDIYFVAIVAGCSAAAIFGVISAGYCFYKFQQQNRAAADVDYPAYGVVGPATKETGPGGSVSPSGDRKLAQSAQMYHYHHQKQQMIASEKAAASRHTSASDGEDSEEENEEGEYTVYECPGLAPTGEMEVKNPLFQDDVTPVTSPPVVSNNKDQDRK